MRIIILTCLISINLILCLAILASRKHYSVDIVIAIYTNIFLYLATKPYFNDNKLIE